MDDLNYKVVIINTGITVNTDKLIVESLNVYNILRFHNSKQRELCNYIQ